MRSPIPHWDASLCRAAIRHCFPEIRISELKVIHGGWDNIVAEVNGALIFRFPRRPEVEESSKREVALIPRIRAFLPLPIPDIRYVWRGDSVFPTTFFGYPKLPGGSLESDAIREHKTEVGEQVSSFINALQRPAVRDAARKALGDEAGGWKEGYRSLLSTLKQKVVSKLEERTRAKTVALFDGFLGDRSNFSFEPVLVHRDLNSNILFDRKAGRISGVIDWGDATIGDPAFDFCGFLYSEGREFVERVLKNYDRAMDRLFWSRMEFYSKVIPYHVVLGGMITGRPYRIEGDEVIVGRGQRVVVFKMFRSSKGIEIRNGVESHR